MASQASFPLLHQASIVSAAPENRSRTDQRIPRSKSATRDLVQKGILWSIIGWRQSKNFGKEFLIRYSRAERHPAENIVYAYAIVDKNEVPSKLIEGYQFDKTSRISSYMPHRRGRRRIECIQDFAWKSNGALFAHKLSLGDLGTKEAAKAVLERSSSQVTETLENLLCLIKWKNRPASWESGLTASQVIGKLAFIQCIPMGFARTIQRWRYLQSPDSASASASSASSSLTVANGGTEIWENGGDFIGIVDDDDDDNDDSDPEYVSVGGKAPRIEDWMCYWKPTAAWIETVTSPEPANAISVLFNRVDSFCKKQGITVCKAVLVKYRGQRIRVPRDIDKEIVPELFQRLLLVLDDTSLPTLGLGIER